MKQKSKIEANGEDKYQTAKETVKPEENQALYYTLTSVKRDRQVEKSGNPCWNLRHSLSVIHMCGVVQA